MDPITKHDGDPKQKELLNKYYGYNYAMAIKMSRNACPYDMEDFLQVGRMAILRCEEAMPDAYFKKAIRSSMLNFKRDFIRKVNRNEKAYREFLQRYEGLN